MFFGDARKPFLDFLRNLGPQGIAFAFALIWMQKIDITSLDLSWEGVKRTAPFLLCMVVFGTSLVANSTLFVEECLKVFQSAKKESVQCPEKLSQSMNLKQKIFRVWRTNKIVFFYMFGVFIIFEACLFVVIFQAVSIAASSHIT